MAVTVKNLSEMFGKDVFSTKGVFAGRIADMRMSLNKFRIHSLVLDVGRTSFLAAVIGNKRGVIIPYQYVENVGDIVLIKHISPQSPAPAEPETTQETSSPFSMF